MRTLSHPPPPPPPPPDGTEDPIPDILKLPLGLLWGGGFSIEFCSSQGMRWVEGHSEMPRVFGVLWAT
jgi:hypothetical protein